MFIFKQNMQAILDFLGSITQMKFTISHKNSIFLVFLFYIHSCFGFKDWCSFFFLLEGLVPPTTHPPKTHIYSIAEQPCKLKHLLQMCPKWGVQEYDIHWLTDYYLKTDFSVLYYMQSPIRSFWQDSSPGTIISTLLSGKLEA